jgi:hypothetical protein
MLGSRPEPYDGPIGESVSLPPPGMALPFPVPVVGLSPKMAPLKQIPVVDPPRSVTGRLPQPLGKVHALPHPHPKTEWYNMCTLDEPWFIEILELARTTDGVSRTREQCVALTHVRKEICMMARRGPPFAVERSTPLDLRLWMEKWVNNPTGNLIAHSTCPTWTSVMVLASMGVRTRARSEDGPTGTYGTPGAEHTELPPA